MEQVTAGPQKLPDSPLTKVNGVRPGEITQGHTPGKEHDRSMVYVLLTEYFQLVCVFSLYLEK